MIVTIRFNKHCPPYNLGEAADFDPQEAEKYLKATFTDPNTGKQGPVATLVKNTAEEADKVAVPIGKK